MLIIYLLLAFVAGSVVQEILFLREYQEFKRIEREFYMNLGKKSKV
jgi:hypothetical protein